MLTQAANRSDTSASAIRMASSLLEVVTKTISSELTVFLYHERIIDGRWEKGASGERTSRKDFVAGDVLVRA
jgi:hypothetical protein